VFFLLLAWSVLIGFDDWRRSKGTKVMVVVNTLAIAATLYAFVPLHEQASFDYHERNGHFEGFKVRQNMFWSWRREDQCQTMQRFAGRWRVIEREIGHYQFNISSPRIDLKPWGVVVASGANWQSVYEGRWRPPDRPEHSDDRLWRGGDIDDRNISAPWDFELRTDLLILTTPEYFNEWERSRITLQRDDAD